MNTSTDIEIRAERPGDHAMIHFVTVEAFGRPDEAKLVDRLRDADALAISMVAVQEGEIAGHIAFSPISIISTAGTTTALALAPMAVRPECQRRGIGTILVQAGIGACTGRADLIIVVGHPGFYPRCGFVRARQHGIECPFPVSDDSFLARELVPGALERHKGMVRYHAAFDEL